MTDDYRVLTQELFAYPYEQVRYEITKFPFYDIRSVFRYVKKYQRKKYSANRALIRHFIQKQSESNYSFEDKSNLKESSGARKLKISLVGDIMWRRKGWGDFMSDEVISFLSGRDIVLGNLETPVSAEHAVFSFMPDLISFNSPPSMLDHLSQCFTALSIVNNHCLDRGAAGLVNTIMELDARKILHAGARVHGMGREYQIIKQKDWKIAFLAYAWGINSVIPRSLPTEVCLNIVNFADPLKPVDYSLVAEHIHRAREDGADLVICSLHWGYEFEMYPTFHMMSLARRLISLGVDVVMGHHPHVLQPFEIIDVNAEEQIDFDNLLDRYRPETRKAVVAYSLGNFVSAMYTKECLQSCILNLDFVCNNGVLKLDAVSYLPTHCIKKQGRAFAPKVIDLRSELKKEHDPKLLNMLVHSHLSIERHIGKVFMRESGPDR
jgi:poly-gamma-glutamate capsule biosynthesis protein CapA/YwtB (metallophosphatase superfamily)